MTPAERKKRNERYEKEPPDWSNAELVEELTELYRPSVIPPCPVCGGPLSPQQMGGGEPAVWACSTNEDDPDKPGYVRRKAGRGVADEHYSASQYIDRRQGGDELVMELIRRFTAQEAR